MTAEEAELVYLVVSSGLVGQFLLEKLTKCSVLPLQIEHQHLQLDALLPQILFGHTHTQREDKSLQTSACDASNNPNRCRNVELRYLLI